MGKAQKSLDTPDGKPQGKPPSNADNFAVLGLLLLAVVPYLNSLTGSFVYDDSLQISGNPYVHSFRYIGKIFGTTVWTFEGAQGVTNYYRPLMTFAYLICYKLFGPVPFGFHLLNVALHAGVVLLLFFVTERLFGDRLLSLVAAGLFALHPVHTESVAWIAGITDLELSFFFLLTFLLYLRLDGADPHPPGKIPEEVSASANSAENLASENNGRIRGGRKTNWPLTAATIASYIFALLSKEQALVLPLLAAAYEHFYRDDRDITTAGDKLRRYAPLWVVAAVYAGFRHFVLGGFAPAVARPALTWTRVFLTAIALIGGYLWKLIWPLHLVSFYVFRESRSFSDPRVLGGLIALIVCLNLFVFLWDRARPISFAFVWMGATLAPVLNARWMPAGVFAERYLYLPSVGFCWLAGWAVRAAWRTSATPARGRVSPARRAVPLLLTVVAILYGVRTIHRNREWRTEEILYRQTLEEQPDAQLIRTNLGALEWDRGEEASAEREWMTALGPGHPYASTLSNLGLARSSQKRYDEAIRFFNQAIALRPKFMDPHKNLADTYAEMGKPGDADREYREAVTLAPLSSNARNAYGHFLLDQGRNAQAQEQFRLSAEADPNADADENLGDLLAAQNNLPQARADYEAALAFNPFDGHAHFGLAAVDARENRVADAIREYRAGLETDPMNADALGAIRRLAAQAASHDAGPGGQ